MFTYVSQLLEYFVGLHYISKVIIIGITGYVLYKLRCYFAGGVCDSEAQLQGKTAIVTGANSGIGRETALELAKRGARVILACRDVVTAEDVCVKIRQQTGNTNVKTRKLNLASLASIKCFAEGILSEEDRLDILINNAGVMGCPQWETDDGFEMHIGVNHLGHFLLTNLLMDLLKTSAPSRIVNVSSMIHSQGELDFEDINMKKNYSPMAAYSRTKLALVLFTMELHRRLKGSGVTANVVNPGPVYTNLYRYFCHTYPLLDFIIKYFGFMGLYFVKNSKQGAQTTIYCAVDEKLVDTSGQYFSDCRRVTPSDASMNIETAERLWDISCEMVGL